nr:M1 family metallopeptidase [Bacteroidota bacterium]
VNNQEVVTELDNTVLKVFLPQPLKSGESIKFNIDFKTYFDRGGSVRRRMKLFNGYGYKHYDGVLWYPRISVYDNKFGWTTDQHLGREFYGNFGTFDVELTLANNFVLDATGNLINREEVLPEELRQKLDIRNFKDKPLYEAPSVVIPYDSTIRKTWKFHAENVHDFAWTADPTYRIGEVEWNGVKVISLAQEPHASRWQYAAEFTSKIIKVYSEDIGMYGYPKMIVADARDGMEYPMLTLNGGFDPDHRSLLAHEVAHNWFYGMVANNETYRAFMDEGFTQFLNSHSLRKIDGDTMVRREPKSAYLKKFMEPQKTIDRTVYYGYMQDAVTGDDGYLNTHSDKFGGALRHGGGYRHVYYKTGVMLYNLQYVLGDELFWAAMQHYFQQWKFCHPYPEDFRNSIIQFTGVDLNWFFDQWLETMKQIDYGVKSVKKAQGDDNYTITFNRKGRMEMPIDFTVIGKSDTTYNFHIPNNWFEKETDATILPRWIGWDKLRPEYEAVVNIPGGIKNVIIDPTERLADINMLDNSRKKPISLSFDHRVFNMRDWRKYEAFWRPDIWYNGYDGIKAGLHSNGSFFNHKHIYEFTGWYNTGLLQNQEIASFAPDDYERFSFRLSYKTSIRRVMKNSFVFGSAAALDGLRAGTLGVERWNEKETTRLYGFFRMMYRPDTTSLNYLVFPEEWQHGKFNNTINFGIDHQYQYQKGTGNLNLHMRSSAFTNDYNFSTIALTSVNKNRIGKFDFNTRIFAQYGVATALPDESALYLYGANPEELMDNKYTRAAGFFPPEWAGFGNTTGHFHHGGGLNLRGYSGYLAPFTDADDNVRLGYKGLSGAAINAELGFDRLITLMPRKLRNTFKVNTYLFADAGIMDFDITGPLAFAPLRADAGIGTALTIKKWGPLQMVKPLTIRFDMPLWLNRTPATDPEYFQFRWIFGINRAF